jgi:putative endonuclease
MGWSLYVLKCKDGTYYTGITNDLSRRVQQHNEGTASRYTRNRGPVKVIFQEPCRGKSSALKKEYAVKTLTRKMKEEYIRAKKTGERCLDIAPRCFSACSLFPRCSFAHAHLSRLNLDDTSTPGASSKLIALVHPIMPVCDGLFGFLISANALQLTKRN